MTAEDIRAHCLSKEEVTESFPFGNDTLVFKVAGKMFLLLSLDEEITSFNAKCDPERAVQLREEHAAITPGYHMNKQHWNTVSCDVSVPKKLILELIDHSYALIVSSLPNKQRDKLGL